MENGREIQHKAHKRKVKTLKPKESRQKDRLCHNADIDITDTWLFIFRCFRFTKE